METVKIYDTMTEEGIILNGPEMQKFLNQKVEIVVSSVDEKKAARNKRLEEIAGFLSEEDAKIFEEALADCRRVYPES